MRAPTARLRRVGGNGGRNNVFKGTIMGIEKALVNDRWRVLKLS